MSKLRYLIESKAMLFAAAGTLLFFLTWPYVWFLALPGLLLYIHALQKTENYTVAFLGSWLVGTLKLAGAIFWLWSAYPLLWWEIQSPVVEVGLVFFFWFTASIVGGLGLTLTGLTFVLIKKYLHDNALWVFPVLWLGGELLFSFLISLLMLGAGSRLNFELSYGYVGLSLVDSPFLGLAKYGGIYALTIATVLLACSLYLAYFYKRLRLVVGMSIILLLCFSVFVLGGEGTNDSWQGSVIAVDTRFTAASQKTENGYLGKRRSIEDSVLAALRHNPEYILLPEDSRFTNSFSSPEQALLFLKGNSPTSTSMVVDSARTNQPLGTVVLRAFVYDLKEEKIHSIDKQFLTPSGEYTPYFYRIILFMFKATDLLGYIDYNQNYVPGPQVTYSPSSRDLPGIVFCYGSVSGVGAVSVEKGSDSPVLLHPVSHAWFNEPSLMWHQLDQMLRVHSVWTGKPIVSAGNLFEGKTYLPNGKIMKGEVLEAGDNWKLVEYNF